MKINKIVLLAIVALGSLRVNASEMFWGNQNNPLVGPNNVAISASSGWVVQMYSAGGDGNINFVAALATGDDSILSFTHLWNTTDDGAGYFFQDIATGAPVAGSKIYTVLFNATTIGAATAYAVVDNAAFTVASYGSPEAPQDYNPGNVLSTDWVAIVPEPSTYAFMGLGAVLLAIRRFRRS